MPGDRSSSPQSREPLVSYRAMFQAEVDQAGAELQRPSLALFASGAVAGAGVGISVLLLALLVGAHGGVPESFTIRLLFGSAYAVGFIIAILGRVDLFTEYTTIAIFPVLTGDSRLAALARLWAIVYAGNLVGGFLLAVLASILGPALGFGEAKAFGDLAKHLVRHEWWVVMLSATVAGWLMGLLSWLIAGGRDTTSQIIFIWLIGVTIGTLGLHHSITGGVEMFAGAISDPAVTWLDAAYFLFWTSLGNAAGGVVFALLVREGVRMQSDQERRAKQDREEGRDARRQG